MSKKGILLVNLGSPDSTAVSDVRRYLNEFLMDGRVIDTSWPVRRFSRRNFCSFSVTNMRISDASCS